MNNGKQKPGENQEEQDPFRPSRQLPNSSRISPNTSLPSLIYFGNQPSRNNRQSSAVKDETDLGMTNETNIMNQTIPPQRINLPNHAQSVSLKDALKCVPEFSGEPGTFYAFQEGCEEAKEMIGEDAETNLVKIIRSKITGEARRSLRGQTFVTVNELVEFLKKIYFPTKLLLQLFGDLGKLHQRSDERVITFANRIREILHRIIEAYTAEQQPTAEQLRTFKANLETNSIDTLKRGLKSEIEQRMTEEDTFANTVQDAGQEIPQGERGFV